MDQNINNIEVTEFLTTNYPNRKGEKANSLLYIIIFTPYYSMKKYRIGYTQGVYDMFHIGHLNLLNNAKKYCDYLIVGINSDKLVEEYKHKTPVIHENERAEIVRNIRAVDDVVIMNSLDKLSAFFLYKFNAIFIGDDWAGNPRWEKTRIDLAAYGVDVVFLPHTDGISSTSLRIERGSEIKENEI